MNKSCIFFLFSLIWGFVAFLIPSIISTKIIKKQATYLFASIVFMLGMLIVFNILFLPELIFKPMGSPNFFFGSCCITLFVSLMNVILSRVKQIDEDWIIKPPKKKSKNDPFADEEEADDDDPFR